ncbi:hypothetical protein AWH62_01720 [Maricaulis sp. W15]|uniref:MarR family transcriptional regulator n=1 Tax=Maricaulis maris TaxID=74318 RepID=A0A495DLK3_9PROT|nr:MULTISPECIES: hypothetical protein [Maricaulis]OLF81414.1 hypothetical protein AWH62_01720 [Maricaulis sp. W15]RKR03816.1 hypothetical protein C7435_0256 [Maricaulis maris]
MSAGTGMRKDDRNTMNVDALADWSEFLEDYARDWDRAFDGQPHYFTQEFWYLFVACLRSHWRGTPITVSAACQAMKTGSNRTREERINRAVSDGFLTKAKTGEDRRTTVLVPSERLEALLRGHLERTLAAGRAHFGLGPETVDDSEE